MCILTLSKAPGDGRHPEEVNRYVVLVCTFLGMTVNRHSDFLFPIIPFSQIQCKTSPQKWNFPNKYKIYNTNRLI